MEDEKAEELSRDEKLSRDMESAQFELKRCFQLMVGRNGAYGDSWKVLSIQSIANLIEMKMNRIARLGEADAKTEDEFMDVVNYAIFGLLKMHELEED